MLAQARSLACEMLASGTTTFEMKSGYGLSREGEIRALGLAAELGRRVPQTTLSTALLAHAVPDGFDAAGWMHEVGEMMGEVLDLGSVSALDIFVETIAFSVADLAEMGALARAAGLALRTHVEQFERLGSVPVALTAGARSVDHLSVASGDDVAVLADAACAAVLLPAAEFLGAEHRAPGRALADAGALVVLATDANPGTAPVVSMPAGDRARGAAVRARAPLETLAACTLNAAWVLELEHTHGSIEPGKRADVLVLDGPVESIAYRLGRNPVAVAFVGGEPVFVRDDWADRVGVRAVTGLSIPAMVNAHSHAFQVGLRGIGERVGDGDDFWSWRREMYRLAGELTPESMRAVGERVYGEMAAAGYGTVGEFHYVVHQPDGTPYDEPNAMAIALAEAAIACGLEIVLLPAAYGRAGFGRPPEPGQRRFCDPTVAAFLARCDGLRAWADGPRRRLGRCRRAQHPRGPRRMDRRGRRLLRRARARASCPRLRAAPRAGRMLRRARMFADRAAGPMRLSRRAGERRARDPRQRR